MHIDRRTFFDRIRSLFNGGLSQGQVDGLNSLLAVWEERYSHLQIELLAYCLATSFLETAGTMQPVRETMAKDDATALRRLNAAYRKGQMPYVKTPYWRKDKSGRAWFGRGHVQLTHQHNYLKAARRLDLPLHLQPDLALDPEVSARILFSGCIDGWFTAHKLTEFIGKDRHDFYNARKVVNPGDRKTYKQIERHARAFQSALNQACLADTARPPIARNKSVKVGGGVAAGGAILAASEPRHWPYVLLALLIAALIAFIIWNRRQK